MVKGAKQVKNVVDANDKARDEGEREKLADIEALPAGGGLSAADAEGSAKGKRKRGQRARRLALLPQHRAGDVTRHLASPEGERYVRCPAWLASPSILS